MKNNYTYQQDELDALLMSKEYDQLNAKELEIVNEQVTGREEYNLMRSTLLNVKTTFHMEEQIIPETFVKEDLMEKFMSYHAKKPSGFWANLKNGLLPEGKNFFFTPAFQLASVAVLVIGISVVYMNFSEEKTTVALNDNKENKTTGELNDGKLIPGKDVTTPEESPAENNELANGMRSAVVPADKNASGIATESNTISDFSEVVVAEMEDLRKADETKSLSEKTTEITANEKSPSPVITNSGTTTNRTFDADDLSSVVTEADKKKNKDKEEVHSAYSKMEKERANKDIPSSGISLGEKPELTEFLFTAL